MTVQNQLPSEQLLELAQDGFPGSILDDLIDLADGLVARVDSQLPVIDLELIEVICQAHNTGLVHAGRTSSLTRLERVRDSLLGFEELLNEATTLPSSIDELDQTLHEYLGHTTKRIQVLSDMIKLTHQVCEERIEPYAEAEWSRVIG